MTITVTWTDGTTTRLPHELLFRLAATRSLHLHISRMVDDGEVAPPDHTPTMPHRKTATQSIPAEQDHPIGTLYVYAPSAGRYRHEGRDVLRLEGEWACSPSGRTKLHYTLQGRLAPDGTMTPPTKRVGQMVYFGDDRARYNRPMDLVTARERLIVLRFPDEM